MPAGQVYNLKQGKQDIDAVYSMGIFEDVNLKPVPAEDHSRDLPKVDLTLNVTERKKMGGLSAGGGISAANHMEGAMPGFIGSASYSQRNLFGLNQKLTSTVEIGQVRAAGLSVHLPLCYRQVKKEEEKRGGGEKSRRRKGACGRCGPSKEKKGGVGGG